MDVPRAQHPPEPQLSPKRGCPAARHLPRPPRLLQPGMRNPTLLVTAAANLDYVDRTGEKPRKPLPWHLEGKVALVPCRAAARVFADGHGSEHTFTADAPRRGLPFQNGCPAPPWRWLVCIHVRRRRGLEALRKHLFVCLFVLSTILI